MNREEEIMQKAIDTYGAENQCLKVVEEMSELTKALMKVRFVKKGGVQYDILLDSIAEEMADVEIMLEQLHMIYQNDNKVNEYRQKKIERLERRLNGHNGV